MRVHECLMSIRLQSKYWNGMCNVCDMIFRFDRVECVALVGRCINKIISKQPFPTLNILREGKCVYGFQLKLQSAYTKWHDTTRRDTTRQMDDVTLCGIPPYKITRIQLMFKCYLCDFIIFVYAFLITLATEKNTNVYPKKASVCFNIRTPG